MLSFVPKWLAYQMAVVAIAIGFAVPTGETRAQAPDTSEFDLRTPLGQQISLDEFGDRPVLVLVFLGTECPLAKLYSLKIQQLAEQYRSSEVTFLAVDSNLQDSLEEIGAFARRQKLTLPVVKDVGQHLARHYRVSRTPEAVVLDRKRQVQYQGRIDDQYGIGYSKKEPEQLFLSAAIDAVLQGNQPAIPAVSAVGCLIGWSKTGESGQAGPEANPETLITFSQHIAPILNEHCVRCHREGQIGPFVLTDYESARGWAEMIAEVVQEKRMPPWHADPAHGEFVNDCSLDPAEIDSLVQWAQQGAPAGDLQLSPPLPQFTAGWQLPGEPDLVIPVTEKPYVVRATGDIRYQYFVHDPQFSEDRWVSSIEIRPGNYSVVHHILCFIRPKGSDDLGEGDGLDHFLAGYVPGMLPQGLPSGYAKRIPANSELVFQVHYTPIGSRQTDQSHLGIRFADPTSVTHEVRTMSAVNPKIKIPAGAADHAETAWNREPLGRWQILNFMPHMHLRGKAFRYEAVYRDGRREVLLDIPQYDFNWQTAYVLKKPLSTTPQMRIFCSAVFDNSTENLNNPNPAAEVTWGDQTWEEMLIGYFDVAIPRNENNSARDK